MLAGIFGKTIIRIIIRNKKLSSQRTLIHRSKFKINLEIIGRQKEKTYILLYFMLKVQLL